jgi:hypothetical protein
MATGRTAAATPAGTKGRWYRLSEEISVTPCLVPIVVFLDTGTNAAATSTARKPIAPKSASETYADFCVHRRSSPTRATKPETLPIAAPAAAITINK